LPTNANAMGTGFGVAVPSFAIVTVPVPVVQPGAETVMLYAPAVSLGNTNGSPGDVCSTASYRTFAASVAMTRATLMSRWSPVTVTRAVPAPVDRMLCTSNSPSTMAFHACAVTGSPG